MRREKLNADELESGLTSLAGWTKREETIVGKFEFSNFADSLKFVNKIGELAEAADHHPDITFGWGYAEIALTTHDRGGVTDVDLALASKINEIES
ncbi:MAG: 4a-hydroxytetrahydrobiopterin dehydratase [Pyrinomonadaceae bacterium]